MSRAERRAGRRRASTAGLEQGDRLEQGRAESRATQGINAELEQGDGLSKATGLSRAGLEQGDGASQNEDGDVEIGGATKGNGDGTAGATASQDTEERR